MGYTQIWQQKRPAWDAHLALGPCGNACALSWWNVGLCIQTLAVLNGIECVDSSLCFTGWDGCPSTQTTFKGVWGTLWCNSLGVWGNSSASTTLSESVASEDPNVVENTYQRSVYYRCSVGACTRCMWIFKWLLAVRDRYGFKSWAEWSMGP